MTNVCIRYTGARLTTEKQDIANREIRIKLLESGRFMVSTSLVGGRPIIRAVISNPEVNEKVVDELLAAIIEIGNEITQVKY